MRLFELLLIITNMIGVIGFGRARTIGRFWAVVTAVVGGLHLVLEQYRWQMVLAYFVAAIVILTGFFLREIRKLGRILLLLLLSISALLAWLFPILSLPPTSGPYSVGTLSVVIDSADRDLVMQVWYPAVIDQEPAALYIPELKQLAPSLGETAGLPGFVVSHVNLITPRAYLSPQMAESERPFPVILFSHGYAGTRLQNTFQVEELASQGYVVAATDHHPAAMAAVFPGGETIALDNSVVAWGTPQETADAQALVTVWANDFVTLLDHLTQWNETSEHPFFGRMDTERVGAFGQSTGGGTAYEFCYRDGRCAAALGLDPWVVPTSNAAIEDGLTQPMLAMSTTSALGEKNEPRLERFFNNNRNAAWWLTIDGTTHYDYTDLPHLSPAMKWTGLSGDFEPMELTRLLNDYTRSFFNHHLQEGPGALLYMESTVFPDVSIRRR